MIESFDQVGMLFMSDLSRQECSTYTTTSQQDFDVPDSPTGHGEEKGFSQTNNTRWRQVTRCVGHEIALLPAVRRITQHLFAPHRVRGETRRHVSHFTDCAEDRIKQISFFTEYADGRNKGFCTPRDTNPHCSGCADTIVLGRVHQAGTVRCTRIRSTTPMRMTMNDANNAALFLMG